MITNYSGLRIENSANAITFVRDENIVAQLIVKKFTLKDGKSGICLYSINSDGQEYFIRNHKPSVTLVKEDGNNVVLIDCDAGKFNIAIRCASAGESMKLLTELDASVRKLWIYRTSELKKFFSEGHKEEVQVKPEVKTETSVENKPTEEVKATVPDAFIDQVKKLRKLVRSGRLVNGDMGTIFTVSGSNCINQIIKIYEEQFDKLPVPKIGQ